MVDGAGEDDRPETRYRATFCGDTVTSNLVILRHAAEREVWSAGHPGRGGARSFSSLGCIAVQGLRTRRFTLARRALTLSRRDDAHSVHVRQVSLEFGSV